MKTYEFNGEKYREASKHQREWGRNLISQLSIKGDEKILDLGCGNGALTEQLCLSVPDGKVFDIIFSNAALHWITNHKRLLKNAYKALKPGGIILWDFGSLGNCSNFLDVIHKKITEEKYIKYFKAFEWPWFMPSKSQYEALISDIGFSNYTITEINRDRYFSTFPEMIKWIDQPSLVPFIKCIPAEWKEAFRKEVIEEMRKRTQKPDGTCFETFRRLKIYGEK